MLNVGDKAFNFNLQGDDGKTYTLDSFADQTVILYFYPKDNTSGCTTQAQEFTALVSEFSTHYATIVGVSPDSVESHKKFKEKAELNILLLSDPDKSVATAFGAYGEKNMYGKKTMGIIRSTFIIKGGIITQAWRNVKAKGHAEKVLCELK